MVSPQKGSAAYSIRYHIRDAWDHFDEAPAMLIAPREVAVIRLGDAALPTGLLVK